MEAIYNKNIKLDFLVKKFGPTSIQGLAGEDMLSLDHEAPGPDWRIGLVGTRPVWFQQNLKQFSKLIPTTLGTYLQFCPKQTSLAPTRPVWPRHFMFEAVIRACTVVKKKRLDVQNPNKKVFNLLKLAPSIHQM